MPKYTVLCRVDAYVDYRAVVEADDPQAATELARECPDDFKWEEVGPVEFDARGYVTLDGRDREIEGTQRGYFG